MNKYSLTLPLKLNIFALKLDKLAPEHIYSITALVAGFLSAWVLRTRDIARLKKQHKSTEGLLESERLMKEKLRKENMVVYQMKESMEAEYGKKLKDIEALNRLMDEDIVLLQKHNEETEALLIASEPEIYALKKKLIEANNTISRYKAQLSGKARTA